MTVTVIVTLKRREGMSRDDFIRYYEAHHSRVGEQVLGGYATRYARRFLTPVDGTEDPLDIDVITEIDFPDQATCDACYAAMADPATMAMVIADEEKLFDRSKIRLFHVDERQTPMPPLKI